jgi:hypothetical protein
MAPERHAARSGEGIYPYETRQGTRYYFKYRKSDGRSATRRGFASPRPRWGKIETAYRASLSEWGASVSGLSRRLRRGASCPSPRERPTGIGPPF